MWLRSCVSRGQVSLTLGVATAASAVTSVSSPSRQLSAPAANPKVRVATYNVLSDSLCRASHYVHSSADALDNAKRFERVKAKLVEEMQQGSVVCLQEISRKWGAKLVPFFEKHGYAYAGVNYGGKFNGYMGNYVAWPRDRYEVVDTDICRISDTVNWIRESKPGQTTTPQLAASSVKSKASGMLSLPPAAARGAGRKEGASTGGYVTTDPDFARAYKNAPPPFAADGSTGGGSDDPSAPAAAAAAASARALSPAREIFAGSAGSRIVATIAGALAAAIPWLSSSERGAAHAKSSFTFSAWETTANRYNAAVMVRLKHKPAAGGGGDVDAAAAAASAAKESGVFGLIAGYMNPAAAALANASSAKTASPSEEGMAGQEFVVATYHMPCLFGSDEKCRVMVAHVALLMQQAQRFAAGDPLVVCGDFNVQPGQPAYDLILSGDMDASHPQHPELPARCAPKPGDAGRQGAWTVGFSPMRSACLEYWGEEPAFTNFAWSAMNPDGVFQATLDYIFYSPGHWKVAGAKELISPDAVSHLPGFPSSTEPSDHIVVAAELELQYEK